MGLLSEESGLFFLYLVCVAFPSRTASLPPRHQRQQPQVQRGFTRGHLRSHGVTQVQRGVTLPARSPEFSTSPGATANLFIMTSSDN